MPSFREKISNLLRGSAALILGIKQKSKQQQREQEALMERDFIEGMAQSLMIGSPKTDAPKPTLMHRTHVVGTAIPIMPTVSRVPPPPPALAPPEADLGMECMAALAGAYATAASGPEQPDRTPPQLPPGSRAPS